MEYMSQEGYDKLVAELHQMESVELPQVREAIAEARDKGDLSENFEYHAAKREQARLLGRIRFKQKVLANARVIDVSRLGTDSVQLLSKVQMTNLANNKTMTYTIASPNEANLREGKISIKSPIAQALLNKKVGDEVEVRVPAGLLKLRIEKIELSYKRGRTKEEGGRRNDTEIKCLYKVAQYQSYSPSSFVLRPSSKDFLENSRENPSRKTILRSYRT